MTEERALIGDVEIVYETIGDPSDPALLLIMGLGTQLIHWDLELCELYAERGFHVIRFDNRDVGLSTKIDAPVPNIYRLMAGVPTRVPYRIDDMAADAFGLLDHLGIQRAHVAGVSMGAMIGQAMAIDLPERVLSLCSMMSTTGDRWAGMPRLRVLAALLRRAPSERDAYIEVFVRLFKLIGSPAYPQDDERAREIAGVSFDRSHHQAGPARQLAAILASGSRTRRLRELQVPTVVIHGTEDPLIPLRGGIATARAIPDAELIAFPGMGHDLPRQLWPRFVELLARNAERAADPTRATAPANGGH